MPPLVTISEYIAAFAASPLARGPALAPWQLSARCAELVRALLQTLDRAEFDLRGEVAIHRSAVVEANVVLKGPLIVGARTLVAAGAYLRGGNWVDRDCVVGPGSELKSSIVFAGSRLAHFNFVGDSIVGSRVNLEAGAVVCNRRNERSDPQVLVRVGAALHGTGCDKFGALLGDACRLGANAVVAPGALLAAGTIVGRAALLDQETP